MLLIMICTYIHIFLRVHGIRNKQTTEFCNMLKSKDIILADLDAAEYLSQMHSIEKEGASFKSFSFSDVKPYKYAGAILVALLMTILMVLTTFFMLWAFKTDPAGSPPLPIAIMFLATPLAVVCGVLYSLIQRINEIKKGEIEDAKKF